MPVSIVVGGQFGSEGKGKVALELARNAKESNVVLVRVGGPNSGHTGYCKNGKKYALRQLPAGCIDRNVDVVFPAGSYIDVDVLMREIKLLRYPLDRIFISKYAQIIRREHKEWEEKAGLGGAIGSTGSGVGGAVMALAARGATNFPLTAHDVDHESDFDKRLTGLVCDTSELLREKIKQKCRVIIEGSQGFGLSLLEGGYWPKATARSTTAAAALAESGLSPRDVDDVVMVLRSYPIRVAGNSGKLAGETTWEDIAKKTGLNKNLQEFTTVTKNLRRVGVFDAEQVKRALDVNNPHRLVMNHLDYVGSQNDLTNVKSDLSRFIKKVESDLGRKIDLYGFDVYRIFDTQSISKRELTW